MKPRTLLDVINIAARLKDTTRHCYTEKGRHESVAEHSWMTTLMAFFMRDEFPDADMDKVIRMCIIHDLGEAFTGDIPVFDKTAGNEQTEEELLNQWIHTLPDNYAAEMLTLYDEMAKRETIEAKIYKALDGLEALIQHNRSDLTTWIPLEYELNKTYAYDKVAFSDYLKELRTEIRKDTAKKLGEGTILETERLVLRPWAESDAVSLFEYAKDPDIGPIAGWPAHKSVEESHQIIQNVFKCDECYAICEKGKNEAIGAISLKLYGQTDMTDRDDECEVGYWLGKPFWGIGYMPEAVRELLRHGFEELGMTTIWCGYYDGNVKSKRVQEKVGFIYHHTCDEVPVPLMNEIRIGHTNYMTKERWEEINEKN